MLFAILSLIIIFTEMYFTRDTAFFYSRTSPATITADPFTFSSLPPPSAWMGR